MKLPPLLRLTCAFIIAAATHLHAAGAAAQEPATPPASQETEAAAAERARINRLTYQLASDLRCPMCQGQSIEESSSPVAAEMKEFIRNKLTEGMTPTEVKNLLVGSYGEWVLLEPRPEGFNLAVYVLPVVVLLGGAAFVVVLTRRWTRRPPDAPPPLPAEEPDLAAWDR
jgi:cytochrome c-type biogenesis protein CcmH